MIMLRWSGSRVENFVFMQELPVVNLQVCLAKYGRRSSDCLFKEILDFNQNFERILGCYRAYCYTPDESCIEGCLVDFTRRLLVLKCCLVIASTRQLEIIKPSTTRTPRQHSGDLTVREPAHNRRWVCIRSCLRHAFLHGEVFHFTLGRRSV